MYILLLILLSTLTLFLPLVTDIYFSSSLSLIQVLSCVQVVCYDFPLLSIPCCPSLFLPLVCFPCLSIFPHFISTPISFYPHLLTFATPLCLCCPKELETGTILPVRKRVTHQPFADSRAPLLIQIPRLASKGSPIFSPTTSLVYLGIPLLHGQSSHQLIHESREILSLVPTCRQVFRMLFLHLGGEHLHRVSF